MTGIVESICDSLAKAVFLGYLKVDDGSWIVSADLDRVDDKGCAGKGCPAVFGTEIALDPAVSAQDAAHGLEDRPALFKPHDVDIIQGEDTVSERLAAHAVSYNISCENGASGTHKRYFHSLTPPEIFFTG